MPRVNFVFPKWCQNLQLETASLVWTKQANGSVISTIGASNPQKTAIALLGARTVREVAFGFISIALPFYWQSKGLSIFSIGVLYSAALIGSALITLLLGRYIDVIGRKRILIVSSLLWAVVTPFLAFTQDIYLLCLIMVFGSVSPTGKEIGIYQGVEQAMLAKLFAGHNRTKIYAWFNLVGYGAVALGALLAALVGIGSVGSGQKNTFIWVAIAYAFAGVIQLVIYFLVDDVVEQKHEKPIDEKSGYRPQKSVRTLVYQLSALFALDSFAAGLVVQSLIVYWFRVNFHTDLTQLGLIFFGTNMLSALSSLAAAKVASKIGLLNTMVFTHLPSNILLILVPFMPNATLAVAMLLARHMLSQMDVPTRAAYSMAMVSPDDRGYLAAWTNGARSFGTGVTPILAGLMLSVSLSGIPFVAAGGLKVIYDISLYFRFKRVPIDFANES
ncbi:MFS transporter [Acidithrix sp. C25]|nr:MFS transporter [Acidithrix sp. C25]